MIRSRITVHVQPKASRSEIAGLHGDALKVRLAAPPVDGAANEELTRVIARWAGVPRSAVTLVSGHTSRRKILEIQGVSSERIQALIKQS